MKILKPSIIAISCLMLLANTASAAAPAKAETQDWKGKPDPSDVSLGVLTGLGVLDSSAGYSLVGTLAKKIVNQGFVPDINNSVWIEGEFGPLFISGSTELSYSAHLRWDFHKDSEWTYYALGGLGGVFVGSKDGVASRIEMFPRFGVGVLWNINTVFLLRAEFSHELIAIGFNVPI